MKNYIGVTGITNISDNMTTVKSFIETGLTENRKHIPSIGFLVIPKTLYGIPPNKGKIPHQRYIPTSSINSVMNFSKGYALNVVHFGAKNDKNLERDIIKLFDESKIYEENLCDTLQLNIKWPDKKQLEGILKRFSAMSIILQLPKEDLNYSKKIVDKLVNYKELIEGVLIDPSRGKGKEFDIDISVELYSKIKEKFPDLIIGITGGLNGENLERKIKNFKGKIGSDNFSIDAEGGLRVYEKDEEGNVIIDMLHPNQVWNYLNLAKNIFTN